MTDSPTAQAEENLRAYGWVQVGINFVLVSFMAALVVGYHSPSAARTNCAVDLSFC